MSTKISRRDRPVVFRGITARITTVLWGVAVVAFGFGVIAWLQGYTFDVELAAIISLAILGMWILGSALIAVFADKDD
jgi:hypothetical protein